MTKKAEYMVGIFLTEQQDFTLLVTETGLFATKTQHPKVNAVIYIVTNGTKPNPLKRYKFVEEQSKE